MTVEPLAHVDTGGDLPAVVLVHGMTFSKATWDPVIDRLRGRFRCLAVDLPGHGESTGSGADPQVVIERFPATVVENGLVKPVVVGHSAGALHATGYGFAHDSAGVVNVDQPLWRDPMKWSTCYESSVGVGLVQVAAYSAGVRSLSEECGR